MRTWPPYMAWTIEIALFLSVALTIALDVMCLLSAITKKCTSHLISNSPLIRLHPILLLQLALLGWTFGCLMSRRLFCDIPRLVPRYCKCRRVNLGRFVELVTQLYCRGCSYKGFWFASSLIPVIGFLVKALARLQTQTRSQFDPIGDRWSGCVPNPSPSICDTTAESSHFGTTVAEQEQILT